MAFVLHVVISNLELFVPYLYYVNLVFECMYANGNEHIFSGPRQHHTNPLAHHGQFEDPNKGGMCIILSRPEHPLNYIKNISSSLRGPPVVVVSAYLTQEPLF